MSFIQINQQSQSAETPPQPQFFIWKKPEGRGSISLTGWGSDLGPRSSVWLQVLGAGCGQGLALQAPGMRDVARSPGHGAGILV